MVPENLHLNLCPLLAEHDQVVRRRCPRARNQNAVGAEKRAGLRDVLGAGVFPLPLGVARPAVGRSMESDRGQRFEVGEAHRRLERDRQLEQFVTDPGRRDRLTPVEMEPAFGERGFACLGGVEHVERSVVPPSARPPAGEWVVPFADRPPDGAGIGSALDSVERVQQAPVADRPRGTAAVCRRRVQR